MPEGKNVKCVKCGYIWFQDAPKHLPIIDKPLKLEPIPKGSSLPVIIEHSSSIWLKILPLFFTFMIIVTSISIFRDQITKTIPYSHKFYNLINLPTTNDINLNNISITRGKDFININGFVVNRSSEERKVPAILLTISDQNGKKLTSSLISSPNHYLNTNEKYPIHKRIFNLPTNSYYVTIDIEDLFNIFG
jgi:hypothetical protein